jgi:hypothetical protein
MWLSPVMAAAAAVATAVTAGNDATAAREQAFADFGLAIERAAADQTQWRQFGQELITEVDRIGQVSCSVVYYNELQALPEKSAIVSMLVQQ